MLCVHETGRKGNPAPEGENMMSDTPPEPEIVAHFFGLYAAMTRGS